MKKYRIMMADREDRNDVWLVYRKWYDALLIENPMSPFLLFRRQDNDKFVRLSKHFMISIEVE